MSRDMIYIYLDFDGVLNNQSNVEIENLFHWDQDHASHFLQSGEDISASVYHAIHKLSIANILQFRRALHVLEDMKPQIVITSSWRRSLTFEQMKILFDKIGIEPLWLHSFTGESSKSLKLSFLDRRAFEIREHMSYHGLKLSKVAILDDMRLFDLCEPELERFVHVSSLTGFDAHSVHALIQMFKPGWSMKYADS